MSRARAAQAQGSPSPPTPAIAALPYPRWPPDAAAGAMASAPPGRVAATTGRRLRRHRRRSASCGGILLRPRPDGPLPSTGGGRRRRGPSRRPGARREGQHTEAPTRPRAAGLEATCHKTKFSWRARVLSGCSAGTEECDGSCADTWSIQLPAGLGATRHSRGRCSRSAVKTENGCPQRNLRAPVVMATGCL